MNEEKYLHCPADQTIGNSVNITTLKNLLIPRAIERIEADVKYRFCSSKTCHVVYYSDKGQVFTTNDLKVSVYQKDDGDDTPICYCWGFTRQDIREEVLDCRVHKILPLILELTKRGRCHCSQTNPQGYCCLSNVRIASNLEVKHG
jgi:Zinc binding domain